MTTEQTTLLPQRPSNTAKPVTIKLDASQNAQWEVFQAFLAKNKDIVVSEESLNQLSEQARKNKEDSEKKAFELKMESKRSASIAISHRIRSLFNDDKGNGISVWNDKMSIDKAEALFNEAGRHFYDDNGNVSTIAQIMELTKPKRGKKAKGEAKEGDVKKPSRVVAFTDSEKDKVLNHLKAIRVDDCVSDFFAPKIIADELSMERLLVLNILAKLRKENSIDTTGLKGGTKYRFFVKSN